MEYLANMIGTESSFIGIDKWDTTNATDLTGLGKNMHKRVSSRQTLLTT